MSGTLENYASAIVSGDRKKIAACFDADIKLFAPSSDKVNQTIPTTSTMLGTAAGIIEGFKMVRNYAAADNWHAILLEGTLDGIPVQIIDQVHLDNNNKIDQVDIFFRPASMAAIMLERVTAGVEGQRQKE